MDYIETNRYLLKQSVQCRHHGDYHTGNLIVNEGTISVIDWHAVDFNNIGDPWYEFNRIGVEYPEFASGQIDGYFGGTIPEEFRKLFALYISASAITGIAWAKHYAPSELDRIMRLNRNMPVWFSNMRNPVPTWYGKA